MAASQARGPCRPRSGEGQRLRGRTPLPHLFHTADP